MNKKKVLIVAPVHDAGDVRVFKKQAHSLHGFGYDVALIANTSSMRLEDGISIRPAWGIRSNRIMRFLSIPAIAVQILLTKSDIVHLHNPDTLPLVIFCKLLGRKVIYDTHEDFSKRLMMRSWIPRSLRAPAGFMVSTLEKLAYHCVDATIVTQPDVARRLGDRCTLIGNAPRSNNALRLCIDKLAENLPRNKNFFRLVYIGMINNQRGLADMVNALSIANESTKARLWLIGDADNRDLEEAKKSNGWAYIDYIPKVDQEVAFSYLLASNAGIIAIQDIGDHKHTDPNKLYEYMAFGLPFIASNFPRWTEKLSTLDAGLFVSPSSPEELAHAITILANKTDCERETMGKNAIAYIERNNWDKESVKLKDLYRSLLQLKNTTLDE